MSSDPQDKKNDRLLKAWKTLRSCGKNVQAICASMCAVEVAEFFTANWSVDIEKPWLKPFRMPAKEIARLNTTLDRIDTYLLAFQFKHADVAFSYWRDHHPNNPMVKEYAKKIFDARTNYAKQLAETTAKRFG